MSIHLCFAAFASFRGLLLMSSLAAPAAFAASPEIEQVEQRIASHPDQTGAYVLENGEEALLTRAWLADQAQRSIDVQYFIWSTDNIGILAAESILRAAERGVQVRVLVDDLMTDADDSHLLALAVHPNIDIRVYNPNLNIGVSFYKRWFNVATGFTGVNQRMHDKTFIVDNKFAITGGRNMAAEYFDYHHTYNFRDRDALLAGAVIDSLHASFERFWNSPLSVPVENLLTAQYDELLKNRTAAVAKIYNELHQYAADPSNFAPEVRAALSKQSAIQSIINSAIWCDAMFLSDLPGKAISSPTPQPIAQSLGQLVDAAEREIIIQSPYLVISAQVRELLTRAIARNVKVRISTNSLGSTDNLQAFSGYRKQRDELLRLGIEIYEYKPNAQVQQRLRADEIVGQVMNDVAPPIFGLHAKTLVIDQEQAFIGTFNLDPRSQNLNTEVGVLIRDEHIARAVHHAIETDLQPENSWNAARDNPDQFASIYKRAKVRLWQWLPLDPLL
jgi:cardiolipin synthase C